MGAGGLEGCLLLLPAEEGGKSLEWGGVGGWSREGNALTLLELLTSSHIHGDVSWPQHGSVGLSQECHPADVAP